MSRIAGRYVFLGGVVVGAGAAVPLTAWSMNHRVKISRKRLEVSNDRSATMNTDPFDIQRIKLAFKDVLDASKAIQELLSQRANAAAGRPINFREMMKSDNTQLLDIATAHLKVLTYTRRLQSSICMTAADLLHHQAELLGEDHPQFRETVDKMAFQYHNGIAIMLKVDTSQAFILGNRDLNNIQLSDSDLEKFLEAIPYPDFVHVRWSYGFNGEIPKEVDFIHSSMSTGYGLHDKSWTHLAQMVGPDENTKWITFFERGLMCLFPKQE